MNTTPQPPFPRFARITDWIVVSGLSRTGTYDALRRGDLKAVRVGGRTLIDVDHGLAWLASRPEWTPKAPA